MNALSLFSGIGGIDLACDWAGIKTVAFCEREPFPQKILAKHWPGIPIYDDVCTLTKERLDADGIGTIDIIHGGYPCQPFSVAGNRAGTEDDRHLWPEVFRLLQEIKPKWFVGENVAGHVTLGLDIVLSDLESIGYTWEAFIVPACAVNAPHRRDRVFIVGYSEHNGLPAPTIGRVVNETSHNDTQGSKEAGELEGTSRPHNDEDVADTTGERCGEARELRYHESTKRTAASGEGAGFNPRGTPSGRLQWAVEPDVGRVANGVPHRVDRLKALGNAVVPQQIYPVFAAIKQIDDMMQ